MKLLSFKAKALLANFAIWTVFICISLSASFIDSSRAGIDVNAGTRIAGYLISFTPWMLVTPIFYWFLKRQQQRKSIPFSLAAFIPLIVWAPFVVFFESLSYSVMRAEETSSLWQVAQHLPLFYWVYCLMLYGVILGACLALIYYRRSNEIKMQALRAEQSNIELQLQLSELQIQSLLSQLEPHFLFNSLNAIASLVRITDKKQALTAIKRLSDLLRYALEASNQKWVSFDQELAFVKDYLSLQQLRFAEKLALKLSDERQHRNQECPPFLLQIFVENAIKHGLEKNGDTMHLAIHIGEDSRFLTVSVKNTHPPITEENKGLGIGLSNLKARLKILYQEPVAIETSEGRHDFNVTIALPLKARE